MRRLLLALILCSAAAHAQYREVAVENGSTIEGRITFRGRPPLVRKVPITKETDICGSSRDEEIFIVSKDGGVKNVVVYLRNVKSGKKNLDELRPLLDQQGCHYIPYVQVVGLHATLQLISSDPILHNVHSFLNGSTEMNLSLPPRKHLRLEQKLDKPGGQQLRCDLHPFMRGGIFVAENPYHAITDADGHYQITDVPPGQYTIATWHEEAGPVNDLVIVPQRASVTWNTKVR